MKNSFKGSTPIEAELWVPDGVEGGFVGVAVGALELIPMHTARKSFSSRFANRAASQLDPSHEFQVVSCERLIEASSAISAQSTPTVPS